MTTANNFFEDWTTHPIGKVTRALVAVIGVTLAVLVVLLATMGVDGSAILVLMGLALAATSLRAAQRPTVVRLATLGAVMLAIPVLAQII